MCFSQLTPPVDFVEPAKVVRAQSNSMIQEVFQKPFQGLVAGTLQSAERGFVMSEVAGTVSDMMKRPSSHSPSDANDVNVTFPTNLAPIAQAVLAREPLHYFTAMFAFWRGSRSLRHYSTFTQVALDPEQGVLASGRAITFGMGVGSMFFAAGSVAPDLRMLEKINVPWYSQVPYCVTFDYPKHFHPSMYTQFGLSKYPTDISPGNWNDGAGQFSLHAGDDFIALHPLPFFPTFDFAPPGSTARTYEHTKKKDVVRSQQPPLTTGSKQ
jgi:hypothetical protein